MTEHFATIVNIFLPLGTAVKLYILEACKRIHITHGWSSVVNHKKLFLTAINDVTINALHQSWLPFYLSVPQWTAIPNSLDWLIETLTSPANSIACSASLVSEVFHDRLLATANGSPLWLLFERDASRFIKGVFWTKSNTYNGAILRKWFMVFILLIIFAKMLYRRCSTGF